LNLVNCESIRRITTWRHVRRCCHGMTKIDRNEIEPDRSHKIVERNLGVPSVESSRSVQGLGKGVSGKPYPHLSNTRRP